MLLKRTFESLLVPFQLILSKIDDRLRFFNRTSHQHFGSKFTQ